MQVVIIYKPGIQLLREFANRGINLDGTFMNHNNGVLLVGCRKISNNEIQLCRGRLGVRRDRRELIMVPGLSSALYKRASIRHLRP